MKIRREVKLAITALAAIIVLVWGVTFLKAKSLFNRNNIFYGIYERVDGLKVSSSVIYRGYTVGQVNHIAFTGDRYDKVLVSFSVKKELSIPKNSIAAIKSADLMGSKAIEIIQGDSDIYATTGDTLYTQLELGIMEQFNKQVAPLKKRAEDIMTSLDSVLMSVQAVFDDGGGNINGSLKSISKILQNMESASSNLNSLLAPETGSLTSLLSGADDLVATIDKEKLSGVVDNLSTLTNSFDDNEGLIDAIKKFNSSMNSLSNILSTIEKGKGTVGKLVSDEDLYFELTQTLSNLREVLDELQKNPKKYINLSIFDFSSSKVKDGYGISIMTSSVPLSRTMDIFKEYPDLMEVKKSDVFYYVLSVSKNLKQAERELESVKKRFEGALIVKISR